MSKGPRQLAMTQWDVFSSNPLEGNSLAVFSDGRGLSDSEMQAIAKEMNLSETTFILPRDPEVERERGVGCASSPCRRNCRSPDIRRWVLHLRLRGDSRTLRKITLELNVGKVPVQV